MLETTIIIVLAVIVVTMVAAFLIVLIKLLRLHTSNNNQLINSNFEWAEKYYKTVTYYEEELQGLYNEFYGEELDEDENEEGLKN